METVLTKRNSRSHKVRGAALVIILAFLVLLTGIVAIFLSRSLIETKASSSSANQTRANLLARSAVDMITGDLRQEIVTGSTATNVGPSTNQTTYYFPMTPTNVVPQRVGNATNSSGVDLAPNLIRRSIRSDTLTVPSRASAVNSSTDASSSGRSVSLTRWNSHYLIPRLNAGSATTDCTPIANFTAPDWVMVTTSGPKVLTTPDQTTIGRYAYAIYDEGGLLDANVAGYPSSIVLSPPSTQTIDGVAATVNGKGSLALADLTAIGMTSADVDNLVGWRNYATVQPTGSLGSFTFPSPSGTNYYSYVSSSTNAFLTVNPVSYNSRTDQAFATRQALLKFQRATGFSQDALQYLGTFSRDVEQPSFIPDPNLSNPALTAVASAKRPKNKWLLDTDNSNDTCGTSASNVTSGANQDLINPALLAARDPSGQLVMRRRFPLSRLALLETAAATVRAGGSLGAVSDPTSQASKIYDYFGLTWIATPTGSTATFHGGLTSPGWVYSHGDATRIYKLSEIPPATTAASANPDGTTREPDFFETLKAVINCDSLGKQEGALQTGTAAHASGGSLIDGQIHNQLIQIGANLIDQYDADSYPTAIFFGSPTTRTFYGVENLPYLYGWQQMWYRMKALVPGTDYDTTTTYTGTLNSSGTMVYTVRSTPPNSTNTSAGGGTGTVYETSVMIQPILWNPHAPDSNTSPTGVPTNFRVTACDPTDVAVISPFHPVTANKWCTTASQLYYFPATASYASANNMTKAQTKNELTLSGSATYTAYQYFLWSFPQPIIDPTSSYITFSTGTSPADFREPYRLRSPNYPAGSNAASTSSDANNPATITPNDSNLVTAEGGTNSTTQFIGFNCGKVWTGPAIDTTNDQKWLSVGSINHDMKLILQYQLNGSWYTYDVIQDVYNNSGNVSTVDNTDVYPYIRDFRTCIRSDPRTDRWGQFHLAVWPSTSPSTDLPVGLTPLQDISTVALNSTGGNGVDGGYGNNAAPHFYLPQGTTLNPNLNSTYSATGAALGLATSSGWAKSLEAPTDVMVNVSSRTGTLTTSTNPNFNPNIGLANTGTSPTPATQRPPGKKLCYADSDAVIRRASSWNFSAGGDGLPTYTVTGYLGTGSYNSRPVILNRPFKSVAEMGYAFSDTPWKEINFFTPESGDAALLDAFCLNELPLTSAPTSLTDVAVAGRVNLNTRQPKVLQALLQGVSKAEGGVITTTEASNAAQALVNWTTNSAVTVNAAYPSPGVVLQGPLRNRSELVGKFVYQVAYSPTAAYVAPVNLLDGSQCYQGFSSKFAQSSSAIFSSSTDAAIKRRCESVMRALVDSGNTRTWNLLIDVVAQTGRYPATATSAADLSKFIVTGETRYWVHVAIDRYTGTIIAESLEPVAE